MFEEIVLAQSNKYDAQALRLLMDMQWQSMTTQTAQFTDELNQVKEQLEYQKKKALHSKQLFEEMQSQKSKIRDQEKLIEQYRRDLAEMQQLQKQQQDDDERLIRGLKQERCASQQNRRSSLLVPKLDLTKVRPYEDHTKKQKDSKSK